MLCLHHMDILFLVPVTILLDCLFTDLQIAYTVHRLSDQYILCVQVFLWACPR